MINTGNNLNTGAVMEKPKVSSRAWDWSQVAGDCCNSQTSIHFFVEAEKKQVNAGTITGGLLKYIPNYERE